jgi:hypothetical protein
MEDIMECQLCGHVSKDEGKFCPQCGNPYQGQIHLFEIVWGSWHEGTEVYHKKFILAKTYDEAEKRLIQLGFNPKRTEAGWADEIRSCNTREKELEKRRKEKAETEKKLAEINSEIKEIEQLSVSPQ